VVVAANTGQAGSGNEMLLGAIAVINQNNQSSSIFYQKLDTGSVSAVGHSQGAVGAINAALNGDGVITSVLALS